MFYSYIPISLEPEIRIGLTVILFRLIYFFVLFSIKTVIISLCLDIESARNEGTKPQDVEVLESTPLSNLKDLKDYFGRRRRRHVKCSQLQENIEILKKVDLEKILNLDHISVRNILSGDSLKMHYGFCSDAKNSVIVYHVGRINTHKVGERDLFTLKDMEILLKWNNKNNNGSIQGFGHHRFCDKGNFKYVYNLPSHGYSNR